MQSKAALFSSRNDRSIRLFSCCVRIVRCLWSRFMVTSPHAVSKCLLSTAHP